MRLLRSQTGAALVTALMLTMLSLVIAISLLYMVTTETRISASQKRYRTALAAAHGGVELFALEIVPQMFQADATRDVLENRFSLVGLHMPQYDCLAQKLNSATLEWSGSCKEQATADPSSFPDVTFRLSSERPGERGYSISTKIVDTVPGNSDRGGIDYLETGSSVSGRDETIHPQHVPGIYSISVQGVKEGADSREKASVSVLYAY